jgi:hypothetical protein
VTVQQDRSRAVASASDILMPNHSTWLCSGWSALLTQQDAEFVWLVGGRRHRPNVLPALYVPAGREAAGSSPVARSCLPKPRQKRRREMSRI